MAYVILAVVIISVLVLWFAISVARRTQQALDKVKNSKYENKKFGWLGHIHGFIWLFGAAAGGFKYLYKEWKTAPIGSSEKLGWGLLLSIICALALWILVKVLDYQLNGDPKPRESGSDKIGR